MYGSAREIRSGVVEMLRPPRRISVSEAAEKSLVIANPSGSFGTWSSDVAPYMVEPMNLLSSRIHEAIVMAGPARSGKTIALIDGGIAYIVTCDPADTLIVQTNQSQAEDFSKARISRAISASPDLAKQLSTRSHDDNVLMKRFRSGMLLRFGWPSVSQLSGKDLRFVLMTDVDNITGDLSIDEAFGMAIKRTQTYMSAGMCLAESSPAKDFADAAWRPNTPHEAPPCDGILAIYNRGDRRQWYWPCPNCKNYFCVKPGVGLFDLPIFEKLCDLIRANNVLALAEKYSKVICPNCTFPIEKNYKKSLNKNGCWIPDGQQISSYGEITGESRRSRIASFWLGGAAAAYQPWESLLERYFQAIKHYLDTGEQRPLKTTINVDQAMPFIPISAKKKRQPEQIQERREFWEKRTVPEWARFLIAAVDVQKNRFVVQIVGFGKYLEWGVIDRYNITHSDRMNDTNEKELIDPAGYEEDWLVLISKVLKSTYKLSDGSGREMQILRLAVDSGGEAGVTERAYSFYRFAKKQGLSDRIMLIKGSGTANAPTVKESHSISKNKNGKKSQSIGDVPIWVINTNILKDTIANDLDRSEPGPGYAHFPNWLEQWFFDELTAETRGPKGWIKPHGARNEAFDLAVYARASAISLGADSMNWDHPKPWACEWDNNSLVRKVGDTNKQQKSTFIHRGIRSSGIHI